MPSASRPPLLLITTFGLGKMRPASGTWGSLPPVALAAGMLALGVSPQGLAFHLVLLFMLVFFSLACLVEGDEAEGRWGKDPSKAVADETAGQCLPLMFLPASATASWSVAAFTLCFAFISFRVLDIVKPWPARQLQRLPAGVGILIDDLIAGVYALMVVQLVLRMGG
jgi:phosphatidylglycerophosphatase A